MRKTLTPTLSLCTGRGGKRGTSDSSGEPGGVEKEMMDEADHAKVELRVKSLQGVGRHEFLKREENAI
jgi:hypothetical protein